MRRKSGVAERVGVNDRVGVKPPLPMLLQYYDKKLSQREITQQHSVSIHYAAQSIYTYVYENHCHTSAIR